MSIRISGNFIVKFIKKYLIFVVLISVLIGVASAYVTEFSHGSTYTSSGELVQNDNNYSLIASYKQFVSSKKFTSLLDNEIKKSNWSNSKIKYDYTVSIEASGGTTTPFFTLQVNSTDQKYAEFLANKAINIFVTNIGKYLSGSNVTIVSNATKGNVSDVKSDAIKKFLYTFVLTFVILSFLLIIKYIYIGKIVDSHYVQDVLGEKFLGTITQKDN
ncbi:hypothetical protein [Lactiplantibacillus modestisalitolerans]|uniref:Capsular polysaccharide biosynthesis protein CpsC n=1 Tax=Lactiplantibacillus modestisalitolerans TaxID=1457219 RepID=A0ABV5WUF4_9LACO|nr:hypothetical protein [Lactiplantibacillus modestisalitolerans]